MPVLSSVSGKVYHSESTEETIEQAFHYAKIKGLCKPGDSVVALHKIGAASVIKIMQVQQ
jgi:pyruvate kinase